MVSPPPATLIICRFCVSRATSRATALVAASKGVNSNAPIGPFHTTVRHSAKNALTAATDCGPASRIISSAAISPPSLMRCGALALNAVATTTSVGSSTRHLCAAAVAMMPVAVDSISGSASEAPIEMPFASKNVLAIAPPRTSPSTLVTRFSSKASLLDTLAPPTTAARGRCGAANAPCNAVSSAAKDRPAAAGIKRGRASTDACARCAQENASPI